MNIKRKDNSGNLNVRNRIKKIKILHILWSGEIGGTEEYVASCARYFDSSKYQIYLCFLSKKGPIYNEAKNIKDINIVFIKIKNGFDILGGVKLALYLYTEKFNIVHSHMRNFLATAIFVFFAWKVPKILTHHLSPAHKKPFLKYKLLYKLFSGCFQKVIAISNAAKKSLIEDLHFKYPEKIEVVYNGIDLRKFDINSPTPSDLSFMENTQKIIGFIGRIFYVKRPLLFVDVAAEILNVNRNFYFIMVGDGPEMKKCKSMIHNRNINENFKLLGFRRDIPNLLRLFDALLFTSAGEGFGIVLIEAMAMGKPVFAVNDGAVSEIIKHKENGILLNTTDPQIIAKEIIEVLSDNTLINKIKVNARNDVRSRFSIEVSVRKTEKIYEELLKDHYNG